VTDGYKLPLEKYLCSIRKMLAYKNQREKAVDTAKKRKDESKCPEELYGSGKKRMRTNKLEKGRSRVQMGIEERQKSGEVIVIVNIGVGRGKQMFIADRLV
jgi:hypothetical protein